MKMTQQQRQMIYNLQNAVWKLEAAQELIESAFPSRTQEEIDAMFTGSLTHIIAVTEIAINMAYEQE